MKAVAYIRVSKSEQELENQRREIEAWAAVRGIEVVRWYAEEQSAWRNGHQSELARLMADLRRGRRYDVLVVWALDRLSREGAAAILNLVNTLKLYRCRVVSLQEAWTELPGELGEVLFAIAGWVARMESQRRSERTKSGLMTAVRAGKRLGRPVGSRDKKPRRKRAGRRQAWQAVPESIG